MHVCLLEVKLPYDPVYRPVKKGGKFHFHAPIGALVFVYVAKKVLFLDATGHISRTDLFPGTCRGLVFGGGITPDFTAQSYFEAPQNYRRISN